MIKSYYQEYMEWRVHFDLTDSIKKYTHEVRYMTYEQQLS